jgi:hypothetical protein
LGSNLPTGNLNINYGKAINTIPFVFDDLPINMITAFCAKKKMEGTKINEIEY